MSELDHQVRSLSVICGMNQRFHQRHASRWGWWDAVVKIVVALLAVLGAILTMSAGAPWWVSWSVAILGAIAAVALNVVPLAERKLYHRDLFRRWSEIREDADVLSLGFRDEVYCRERFEELERKRHRTCAIESAANDQELLQDLRAEQKSQGLPISGELGDQAC